MALILDVNLQGVDPQEQGWWRWYSWFILIGGRLLVCLDRSFDQVVQHLVFSHIVLDVLRLVSMHFIWTFSSLSVWSAPSGRMRVSMFLRRDTETPPGFKPVLVCWVTQKRKGKVYPPTSVYMSSQSPTIGPCHSDSQASVVLSWISSYSWLC